MEVASLSKDDNQKLLSIFDEIYDECFSFAFVLAREELRASESVHRAIELCLVTQRDFIISLLETPNSKNHKKILTAHILKNIFSHIKTARTLGLRESDLSRSLQILGRLNVLERAIIYLRHKTPLTWEDMEFIFSADKVELITALNAARSKFAADYGIQDYD